MAKLPFVFRWLKGLLLIKKSQSQPLFPPILFSCSTTPPYQGFHRSVATIMPMDGVCTSRKEEEAEEEERKGLCTCDISLSRPGPSVTTNTRIAVG